MVNTVSYDTSTTELGIEELEPSETILDECPYAAIHGPPPWQDGQEWANALTHAIAAVITVVAGHYLVTLASECEVKNARIIHPTRLAVSGSSKGPGLYEMLALLGQSIVVDRLRLAIDYIGKMS